MKVVDLLLSVIFIGAMVTGAALFALGWFMGKREAERDRMMEEFYRTPMQLPPQWQDHRERQRSHR